MSKENETLLSIRRIVSKMPPEDQKKIYDCADELRALIGKHGDHATTAIALIGAGLAAREGGQ